MRRRPDDFWLNVEMANAHEMAGNYKQTVAYRRTVVALRPSNAWTINALGVALVFSGEYDEAIKASHHEAFDDVGLDIGTPVIRIRGKALFGSVMTPAPKGEAAGELWDGLVLVSKADGFFELKRSRDRRPSFE